METTLFSKNGTASQEVLSNSTIEDFVQPQAKKSTRVRTVAKVILKALSESMVRSAKYNTENIFLVFFDARWSWDTKIAFLVLFKHLGLDRTVRYKNRTLTFRQTVNGKPYLIIGYCIRALKDELSPEYQFDMSIAHEEVSEIMRKPVAKTEPEVKPEEPEDYDSTCDGNKYDINDPDLPY